MCNNNLALEHILSETENYIKKSIIITSINIILAGMKAVQNILHKTSAAKFSQHKCQTFLFPLAVLTVAERKFGHK